MRMLTSEAIREFAVGRAGVDKLGVANIERFAGAPAEMDPLQIMPAARSVVVFLQRVPRGCYRGIDEGTHWPSYTIFGYSGVAGVLARAGYRIARFIESHGWEAVPISARATVREYGPAGPSPGPGRPPREVTLHFRIAAVLAGLGEIGWSKVFLTEEFGPRQRIGILLTDAELQPDPVVVGKVCDRCKRCVAECPAGAIPKDGSVSVELDGCQVEWADIDLGKCKLTHFGLNRSSSPFLAKQFPGLDLTIGRQQVTWKEAWDLGWAMFPAIPTFRVLGRHPIAICGARGCVIACLKHLEEQGKLGSVFRGRGVFSTDQPWRLPAKPPPANHHGFVCGPERED